MLTCMMMMHVASAHLYLHISRYLAYGISLEPHTHMMRTSSSVRVHARLLVFVWLWFSFGFSFSFAFLRLRKLTYCVYYILLASVARCA